MHPCSIDSPSRWIRPVAGGRAPGSQANGSFPKGTGRLSEKSPAGYPPPHHREDTPRERGRPARILSLGLPLSFPAMLQPATLRIGPSEAEPWRFCPVIPARGDAEAVPGFLCGRDARAPGGPSSHNVVAPKEVHRSWCRFAVSFVSIHVHSWFVFSNDWPLPLVRSARHRGGLTCLNFPLWSRSLTQDLMALQASARSSGNR